MTSEEALALVEATICHSRRTARGLNSLQRTVFRYAWEDCSYGEMARQSGYELSYVKQAGSQLWQLLSQTLEEKVTKHNVQLVLQRNLQPVPVIAPVTASVTDWGDAVDVSCFYGRECELEQLMYWTVTDRCRLVGIFGMGGIGKTALSIRLAQQLSQQQSFSRILWRSLRNAPPLSDLIADLLQVISPSQVMPLPKTLDQQISRLLSYLRQYRCLIVLDNGETVMPPAGQPDTDQPSDYELFWQQLGQTEHQSAILLTSREKPKSIAAHEGKALPVRSLRLTGLPANLGQALFDLKGDFSGTASEWQQLVAHYAGNPLALKMVAAVIQELFDGQLGSFLDCLQAGTAIFGDIQDLLSQQINRLSVLEQQTLDWLAIARKPIILSQLRANFTPVLSLGELLAALSALERRSLIEKLPPSPDQHQPSFTLQPVVMEYVTQRLIERVCENLLTRKLTPASPLASHALIQAQAKDYIRETQTRLILQPVIDRLLTLGSRADWAQAVRQWLDELRQAPSQTGYAGGNLINLLVQMQIDLSGWDFSQLPVWSAYLKGVNLHQASFAGADLAHSAFSETFSQVLAVAFSPDGKLLATGDVNHEIQLWQVSDGKPLLTYALHEGWIWSVAFSPDGRLLAGSANRAVHLWDVQSGALVQSFGGYSDRVFSVAFSPDGHLLATGSEDRLVRIWDLRTGKRLHQLSGHTDEVRSVAFAGNHPLLKLASASYDGTVRLWDAASGTCLQVLSGDSGWLWSVAFSPDGQTLASGGASGQLKLWQVKTGRVLRTLNAQQQIRTVAFSPDGRTVASGSEDGKVRLWNYRTGAALKVLSGHTSWISAIAFSVDQLLASGSEDRSVRLWQGNLCLRQLRGYSNGVWSVAFNQPGNLLASGSQDRSVRLWSADTGKLLGSLAGHTSWIWSVAFSPTQLTLASSSEDRTIRIWEIASQRQLQVLTGHQDAVLSLLYSPDGSLWSGSLDGTLKHWSPEGSCLQTLSGHGGGIWSVALSLDGRLLVSGSQDQTLKLWDAASGNLLATLSGHQSWIRAVAISPDCQTLCSGSAEGLLKIWRLDRGQYRCQQTYAAHSGPVLSIAVHQNGQQIATSSTDRSIKLWDLPTGACTEIPQAHQRWVKSLTYSPDGLMLASCSQDESIKLWGLPTSASPTLLPTLAQTLRIPRPYEGLKITQATGLTAAQQSALKQLGAVEDPNQA
ncbi:MAG: WD40 repeat domain-containing protein [Pegethrix bostrychoides GSE-TBD4-15B]|jgi:WD40 repeat protein|uniref:WD40 repeat domain-containing protein n=1 Tax=Pegethrix bostrychoides GSE-TBD4-15B TaxID=2839662 RepID=A0A951P9C8_9CYAN|nr:WD40 repeat domain-containing protein [Pegethrix bostrychoides GSE-TBD4-15B]